MHSDKKLINLLSFHGNITSTESATYICAILMTLIFQTHRGKEKDACPNSIHMYEMYIYIYIYIYILYIIYV